MDIPQIPLRNGIMMPVIGLGTHTLHGNNLKYIIEESYNYGVRLIDTAWYYRNEKEIGRILKNIHIQRENIFLTSKVTGAQLYGRKRYLHLFKRNVKQAYEDSCRRLKTDYLDLFLLHSWQFNDNEYEQLIELYQAGNVRSIGITQATSDRLNDLKVKFGILPHVNEIHVQPFLTKKQTLQFSKENGVQSQVISAVKGGDPRLLHNPLLLSIAKKYNVNTRQVVYRWILQQNLCFLTRSSNIQHFKNNIDIFKFSLSNEEMSEIDSLNCGESFVPYEFEGSYSENK